MLLIFCRISETASNSELSDLQEQRFCDFLECKLNSKSICRNIELLSNSQVGLSPSDLTSAVSFGLIDFPLLAPLLVALLALPGAL